MPRWVLELACPIVEVGETVEEATERHEAWRVRALQEYDAAVAKAEE